MIAVLYNIYLPFKGSIIKKIITKILNIPYSLIFYFLESITSILNFLHAGIGDKIEDAFFDKKNQRAQLVTHLNDNGQLFKAKFYTPNRVCSIRAKTFSTKEPETLKWIDSFGNGPFMDVGANVGLYSIYFAATKKMPVYSIEPSFFNLALLGKNIHVDSNTKCNTV